MKKKIGIAVIISGIITAAAVFIHKYSTKRYIVQTIYH